MFLESCVRDVHRNFSGHLNLESYGFSISPGSSVGIVTRVGLDNKGTVV